MAAPPPPTMAQIALHARFVNHAIDLMLAGGGAPVLPLAPALPVAAAPVVAAPVVAAPVVAAPVVAAPVVAAPVVAAPVVAAPVVPAAPVAPAVAVGPRRLKYKLTSTKWVYH
jgi:hypothetical protein